MIMNVQHSLVSYLHPLWTPSAMAETIAKAKTILEPIEFDTVVGTGLSGSLFGLTLAHTMDKNLLIIRKPGAKSHSHRRAEGTLGKRWIFVDDLVDTGETLCRVKGEVLKFRRLDIPRNEPRFKSEYVGRYLYNDMRFTPVGEGSRE